MKQSEELLDRFYSGKISDEEAESLKQIFGDDISDEFEQYSRRMWKSSPAQMDAQVAARMRARIMEQIGEGQQPAAPQRRIGRWLANVARVSAAASVIVATAVGAYWFSMSRLQSQSFEVTTLKGQKSMVVMPDGSRVRLNSASKVVYTAAFNRRDRKIRIEGEAFFEVAKNPELPFTVTAGGIDVTALGTKFNVRAYAEDREIVTTLVEGKVAVETKNQKTLLEPGQLVRWSRDNRNLLVQQVASKVHAVPWINNELMFRDESLLQIARELERMYNVNITFRDYGLAEYRYTGLVLNNNLTNVLDLITTTSPVRYQMNDNTIEFSRK